MTSLHPLGVETFDHFIGDKTQALHDQLVETLSPLERLLDDLYAIDAHLRLVPLNNHLFDLPETARLRYAALVDGENPFAHAEGLYLGDERIAIVGERHLHNPWWANQKIHPLLHELAHAVWDLVLSTQERWQIELWYVHEKKQNPDSEEYRLKDVKEFFAESFVYHFTQEREKYAIGVTTLDYGVNEPGTNPAHSILREIEYDFLLPGHESLRSRNPAMSHFLHTRFENYIDRDALIARPEPLVRYEKRDGVYVAV